MPRKPLIVISAIGALGLLLGWAFAPSTLVIEIPHDWENKFENTHAFVLPNLNTDDQHVRTEREILPNMIRYTATLKPGEHTIRWDQDQIYIEYEDRNKFNYELSPIDNTITTTRWSTTTVQSHVLHTRHRPPPSYGGGGWIIDALMQESEREWLDRPPDP